MATTPQALLDEAKCYECYGAVGLIRLMKLALLRQWLLTLNPAADVSPQGLLEYANVNCYACAPRAIWRLFKLALLAQLASGSGGAEDEGGGGGECVCSTPTITSTVLLGGPPYSVTLNWSFTHGNCPVALIEIWKNVNGGAYSLFYSVASNVTTYTDTNAGSNGQTVCYKLRYVNDAQQCDFSAPSCSELQPE